MKYKSIIWDMDGVISDTQSLHARVESELLARYDIHMTSDEITAKYAGVRTADFFKDLLERKGAKDYDIPSLMKEKWDICARLVDGTLPISGSLDLIKRAYDRNIPQAVASASGKNYVHAVLNKLEVINYFKAIVSGDQVSKGKPDPEIFLTAAKRLNLNPTECVVIEDGRAGMIGARNAGMKVIGLVQNNENYPADILVDDLRKLSLDDILN